MKVQGGLIINTYNVADTITASTITASGITASTIVTTERMQITSGATDGYVLTSDAAGNAIWQATQTPNNVVVGSGTTNYVAKWDSSSGLSSTSLIYDDGTNVGIGTTTPTEKLEVSGNALVQGNLTITGNTSLQAFTGTSGQINGILSVNGNLVVTGNTGVNWFSGSSSSDFVRITQTGTGNAFVVEDSTSPDPSPFVIDASGNTGVGTTTPTEKLEVNGKTKTINFQMTSGATVGYVLTSDASGNASWNPTSTISQTDIIYVDSVNGVNNSDLNRGNIDKPYATIEYALSSTTNTGTITGDTINGSTTLTGVTSTANIKVGQYIVGTNIPYGSMVVTKTSNTITLSKTVTGTTNGITITWYTPKLITTLGNFNVSNNLFKDGFSYDFGNSNITFSTILLNVTSIFYTPFNLIGNGEIVGTGTTSQLLVNSANQDSLSDFRININRYYSRGTGYQVDINQYSFNIDMTCVDFNSSFGSVCRIGFISDSPGRQIFKGYFYGLLGGFSSVYKTSGVFGIEGVVECPSTITAISTNINRGYLNGSVIGKCQFINFAVNGNITGDVVCANTSINGTISTVANTTYIYNKSTIGWLLANGNVTFHGDAFDNGIEIRKLTGAGTITSSTQANVTIDMLQSVTINWSTGNLTILNGGGYYANSPIIDVSGGEVSLYGRHFFYNSPGLRATSNGVVNIFGSILESGVINCSGGRINNYGRVKSAVNVSSGYFYNSGHIISDGAITQTSGTVELDGGTLEMSTTGTTAYLISKTSGTLLLRGQARFKVLNGKGPIKCTANTSASKDIYNFSTITNCDGTTYGLLLPWDGASYAANDLVGGTTYENTSY